MDKNQVEKLRMKSKAAEKEKQKENDKLASDVVHFYYMQQRKKQWDEQFEQAKKMFYQYMDEHNVEEDKFAGEFHNDRVVLNVKKIQKKVIIWNTNKLFKKLSKKKKARDKVIQKKYFIFDMEGLVKYLKECNVDPKIFKSFLEVDMSVNENALNNLHDLGEISKKDISGCYEVKKYNPYWTVRRQENE